MREPACRATAHATETTPLVLDYAFTALGLHIIMLTVFEFKPTGTRFRSS